MIVWLAAVCGMASPVRADLYSYGFNCITSSTSADAGIGETQFSVEVSQGAAENQVLFRFVNTGLDASSITDIYFYDGVLLGYLPPAGLAGSDGVFFSEGACPKDLPGLSKEGLARVFSADSDSPVQPSGVNPDEWLSISFTLGLNPDGTQKTWEDVVAGLTLGLDDPLVEGAIRIGIHGQGFADNGSESFINGPGTLVPYSVVPTPAAVLLGTLGLGAAGVKLRRFV
jgi:hypothetical protein